MDEPTRGSRRRLMLIIAIGTLVLAAVIVATLITRSNEPVRSVAGTCDHLAAAKDLDRSLTSLDPATLGSRLTALEQASSTAPSDIAPQITALSTFVSGLQEQIDRLGVSDRRAALADALAERADQIDAITAAGTAVQTWASTNCAIQLGDDATSSSTSLP